MLPNSRRDPNAPSRRDPNAPTDHTGPSDRSAYYHADGNGNGTAMINTSGRLVAHYHYDPYGNLVAMAGPLAQVNRYRYSNKEIQPNSKLYYYGFRFYDPSLQRWINQDPIGEVGGINLYGFVGNDPANRWDMLGLKAPHFRPSEGFLAGTSIEAALAFDVSLAFTANATWDSAVREMYSQADARLKAGIQKLVAENVISVREGAGLYIKRRNELVLEFRSRSTPAGRYIAEALKPSSSLPSRETLLAKGKTDASILGNAAANKKVSAGVTKVAGAARVCTYVTFAFAFYDAATAEPVDRPKIVVGHIGGFTGAIGGAYAVGKIGGAAGTAVGGPPGGAIGAVSGTIIGGIGGGFIGQQVSEQVFDAVVDN